MKGVQSLCAASCTTVPTYGKPCHYNNDIRREWRFERKGHRNVCGNTGCITRRDIVTSAGTIIQVVRHRVSVARNGGYVIQRRRISPPRRDERCRKARSWERHIFVGVRATAKEESPVGRRKDSRIRHIAKVKGRARPGSCKKAVVTFASDRIIRTKSECIERS